MSFHELAAAQHGIVDLAQLQRLGLSRSAIRWAVTEKKLVKFLGTTFRIPGAPSRWEQRAMAATLITGPGSALSHATAGLLWRVEGFRARGPIHVLSPRATRTVLPPGFVLHRSTRAFSAGERDGLRVTSLARTLLDVAESLDDEALELALDSSQYRNPQLERELDLEVEAVKGLRAPGARRITELLDVRGGVATESPLETRVRRRLRASTLPAPTLQHDVFDDGHHVARVDFAWRRHRVALHCDGFAWHGRRRQFELDARQRSHLAAMGWVSLIVTQRSLGEGAWLSHLTKTLQAREPQLALTF